MSRLFDCIMTEYRHNRPEGLELIEYLAMRDNPNVIVADDIVRYFLERDQFELSEYGNFPSLAPPFGAFFIEANPHYEGLDIRFGLSFASKKTDEGWDSYCNLFYESTDTNRVVREANFFLRVDKAGSYSISRVEMSHPMYDGRAWEGDAAPGWVLHMSIPLLFAISVANCKNVQLIDNVPPRGLSRKQERRSGVPLVTFKTLSIKPSRIINHLANPDVQQSPDNSQSRQMPLHIARGHFKDYRDSKGLFGNPSLKGVYWWDQHFRGNLDNGVTIKDYNVQAPVKS